MVLKRRVKILIIIAIILAVVAISLNVIGPEEISTNGRVIQESSGAANVGVDIQPAPVEDKLAEENQGAQS